MPFELPPPDGPPRIRREPAVKERIHPLFGLLRWGPDAWWSGTLPRTGSNFSLHPEPETPDEFPDCWTEWFPFVDRDPSWITPLIKRKLKELAGYGWPVLPFEPKIEGAAFDPDAFSLYLSTPTLEYPHLIDVRFDAKKKIVYADLCG